MWSITYLSTEVDPFTRSGLYDLLAVSRRKNTNAGITGLLLYRSGNFIQTIEGPEKAVQDLYELIQYDGRHEAITTIFSETVATRKFPDWSMGFRDLSFYSPEPPTGFSTLLNEPWNTSIPNCSASQLRAFLETFVS